MNRLSLQRRLFIVSEAYKRINKNNKIKESDYSIEDIGLITKRFIKYIDAQLYELTREGLSVPVSLTEKEKEKIAELAINGALLDDYERFNELIVYLDQLGLSVASPAEEGKERLYLFFSGDIKTYMGLWKTQLSVEDGPELSDIQDIIGLRFMIDMAESLKLNIVNSSDKAMVSLIHRLKYKMISYASSVYATYSAERGGTVYVSSPNGLRVNNYFWNSELPILRALQKEGLIGDIRILHKPLAFYKDTPLAELGDLLTTKDLKMMAEYDLLPAWWQEKLLADIYQQWLYEEFQPALLAVRKNIIKTIDLDRKAPQAELLRHYLAKIHEQLDEIAGFKTLTDIERVNFVKRKLARGNEVESWLDNLAFQYVDEMKGILGDLLQKENILLNNIRDIKKIPIPLEFKSDVINIHTDQLKKTFLPFSLLRDKWDAIISDRNVVTGTLTIHFSANRKIFIKVDTNHNQLKQMATLERFLLANFTPENIPLELKLIENSIISGDTILAQRENNGNWSNDQQMIEKVKLSEFDFFLQDNKLGIKVNDNGFTLYSIENPEDNRVIILEFNDDYHIKSIKNYIGSFYFFFDEVPYFLIMKKNVENKECVFSHSKKLTYQVGYKEGDEWVEILKKNPLSKLDILDEMYRSVYLNKLEKKSIFLIIQSLKKYLRLVSILPDTHHKVIEHLLDMQLLLKKNRHRFEHPSYRSMFDSFSDSISANIKSLQEIKDYVHLLPLDIKFGQYINTWANIREDVVLNYSNITNITNEYPQFILLLQDDFSSQRSGETLASFNPKKSVVFQFDVDSSESRIAYGNPKVITESSEYEFTLVTHGSEEGLQKFTIPAICEVYKAVINLFKLSPPARIRLLACNIGDNGSGPQGFNATHPALQFVNMMHHGGLNIPIIAYTNPVGVANLYPGKIVTFTQDEINTPLLNVKEHKVVYHYKNGILFTNGIPVVEQLLNDVRNKIKSTDQLITSYSQYLEPFFSDYNGVIDRNLLDLTINDTDTRAKFEDFLDIIRQRPALRQGAHWQSIVINNPDVFTRTPLNEPLLKYPDIYQVNNWDSPAAINMDNRMSITQYDLQIIFQCENNPTVNRAATRLAGKHAKHSIIVQLDAGNNYRAFILHDNNQGEWREMSNSELIAKLKNQPENRKLRWQVVGHGRSDDNHYQTLAGQRPEQLTTRLNSFYHRLQTEHKINISPQKISLVGCAMSSNNRYISFAHNFMLHMDKNGIRANVSASINAIEVDPKGHKHDVHIPDIYNNKYPLLIKGTENLYWNHWGEITTQGKSGTNKSLDNTHSLMNRLTTGKFSVSSLDVKQQKKLSELFPILTERKLNKSELLFTLYGQRRMQALTYDLQFLQQIADFPGFGGGNRRPKAASPKSRTAIFGKLGYGLQGYGVISSLRLAADYQRWVSGGELTEKQEKEIQLQLAMACGGIGANLVTDGLRYAFSRWGIGYLQKLASKGGELSPALLSQLRLLKRNPALLFNPNFLKDLRKLALRQFSQGAARFSMPILSALTSGIDIYQAYHAFSQLATETDPHVRRDLIASGIFSTINAAIGFGVAFAMAMGGTAATVAGPAGIALAFTMIIVGDIYSAVSQIEKIKDIVPDMTAGQRFENGLRLFLKFGLTPDLDNQIRYNQTMESVYQRQRDYYETLLASKRGVDTLFYSRGEAVLKAIPFIKRDERSQTNKAFEKISSFLNAPFESIKTYTQHSEMDQHEYYELDKINSVNDYIIADFFDYSKNGLVVKIQNLNSHHELAELDGEATYSSFILSADVDRNGLDDFIVIHEKYNRSLASRKNYVGMTVVDDYLSSWHYELYTWLAQPDGSYLKIDTRLEWEKLPYPVKSDEFHEVVFPVLGDFNGDNLLELVIFHGNQMTIYHYDSLDLNQSGKGNNKIINIGDFIEPVKQNFDDANSKDYPYSLSGDINNDGFDDIILLNKSGAILQLLGNENGIFKQHNGKLPSALTDLLSSFNFHRSQLQFTDLNKDGILDLVIILDDGVYYQAIGHKVAGEYKFGTPLMTNEITTRKENGDSVCYRQNRLAQIDKHKIISISQNEQGEHRLISLSNTGKILAHPLHEIKENNIAALFDLGGGDDYIKGYRKKKNIFSVGEGYKQYHGGENTDTFILTNVIGTKINTLKGGGGSDTIVLGEALGNEVSSIIDIKTGYYNQIDHGVEKRIALLFGFENVLGHESVNDTIIGNNLDNYLNGMGGDDKILGNEGNDLLVLQSGLAQGGTGLDSYHILKNSQDQSLQIRIEEIQEESNTEISTSNIFLDHSLNQITSIELDNLDVLINVQNDNGFMTQIRLVEVYKVNNNKKQQILNFTVQTVDGFTVVPLWPSYFNEDAQFSPNMVAYYSSLTDRNYKELVGQGEHDDIVVQFSLDNGNQQQQIIHIKRVEGEKDIILRQSLLPEFIMLSPPEHSLLMGFLPHYELLGDNENNVFQVLKGRGLLEGKGGNDTYFIQEEEGNPTEIIINNFDDVLASDTLVLSSWLLSDVMVDSSGDDILLHYRDQPEKHQSIRLLNYMKDERYRHLKIIDKSGQSQYFDATTGTFLDYQIIFDLNGTPLISAQQAPAVSAGDDEVVINSATFLPGNYIDTGDGNDAIIYIRGHEGTMLKGGNGDDAYYYSIGSGSVNIFDASGVDHLHLDKNIMLHTLSAERRENNLVLNIEDHIPNRITFIDWYLDDQNKIEFIWVEGSQISFDELFILRPYSSEYYQLCQQLNTMGLTLTVRQLADINAQGSDNTLNQLKTIKAWATKLQIHDPADLDYLVAMASVAWHGNTHDTNSSPLIGQKIDLFFQPLIADRISLTQEQVVWIVREGLDTVDIASWVKNYHLRSRDEINYLLQQLSLLKESPLSDKALDFIFKNRIDLTQTDIELCQQEYGLSRQNIINLAMKYHVTGSEHFNLLISNIQVLKEYGVEVSESKQPLILKNPINLKHYFNQKNVTQEEIEFDGDISQLVGAMGGVELTEAYSPLTGRHAETAITTHQFVSDPIETY
jgi:Ca2+-binding RTX toxin-like protein